MGLEVWGDGTFILRPTCRTHIGAVRDWHVAAAEPYAAIFELGSTREGEIIMSEDCKGGAQEEDTTVEFRSPGTGRLDIVSRGEDDSITFQSPVSGNMVASFSASSFNHGCFATLARVLCRGEIRHPPFAITFVLGTQVLAEEATWIDLGCPDKVEVVFQPIVQKWNRRLLDAIKEDAAEKVLSYLRKGQDPNTMYRHGSLTALAFATMVGSSNVVSVLLAGAADPNLEGCSGVVPLHLVQTGDVTMLLLTHGADPNWQDVDGTTAAHIAAQTSDSGPEILQRLVEKGADLMLEDKEGYIPFTVARTQRVLEVVMETTWSQLLWKQVWLRCESDIFRHTSSDFASQTCKLLYNKSLTSNPCSQDRQGGSDQVPVLQKEPHVWLRLCHNRAAAWDRKQSKAAPRPPPTVESLGEVGLSVEQIRFYLASYERAMHKRVRLQKWEVAMPPFIRQTFGVLGQRPCGVRIPLPPLVATIIELPASVQHDSAQSPPEFTWLQECHPHERDSQVRFEANGHKYFVGGEAMDLSVTSFVALFAEAGEWDGCQNRLKSCDMSVLIEL